MAAYMILFEFKGCIAKQLELCGEIKAWKKQGAQEEDAMRALL